MTRNTTPSNRATICAADVIRALQDAAATAYPTRDDMADSAPNFDQQARALVYLCSETADRVPQEHWESQEFTVEGLTEQHTYGIQPGDHDIRARMQATQHAMQSARDAAAAELRAHCPDSFIRIRTGERSTMKILNTRERISEMVATVRRSPGLFGGGKVDKVAPARKATTWKARSVSMVWELIQDGDYSAALAMADTLGAMFYEFNGHAGLTWAPMPVDGMPEGFVSARRWDGAYTVFHTASMLAMNGNTKATSRNKAEQVARDLWNNKPAHIQAAAIAASINCPHDQAAARATWIAQLGIQPDPEALQSTEHDTTEDTTSTEAARQVSELIASATAAAVIEQASEAAPMATPDECEADPAPELATVDACSESEASTTTCDASSAGSAPSTPQHGYASSRPHRATHDAHGQRIGQRVAGNSGHWRAVMFTDPDGRPSFEFDGPGGLIEALTFATGRDRMAALQAMARQADQAAQDTDDQDDQQTERERRLNAFDAMTATAADVQAMGAEYVALLGEDLEDINHHTEYLTLQCLAAGREDLAARARANLREHLAAGYLTDALRLDRQAISEALRQSTEPDPTHPAGDTPSSDPTSAPGYAPPAPDAHQQTAPVPNLADKVPRAVGADSGPASNPPGATAPSAPAPSAPAPSAPAPDTEASADEPEPEFTRTAPQPFDMLDMIAAGLAPDDFVGLGIVYSGDRANPSGCGAITDVQPCSWYKYTVTVTLEDGRQSRLNPVSFTEHLGNRYRTDFKRHGAPYLAELAAARLAVEAADKAAKQAAADDKARQRRELPQQWPQLKAYDPAGKLNGPTLAAHNIRVLLKERFPKIKFSVKSDRYSGGDAIDIRWTDGPNTKAVEKIADQFEAGSFNGQEDIYEYAHSVFRDLFGDAKYIHCHRDISDALLSQAIAAEYLGTESRPTVEDYRKAQGVFSYQHRDEWHARRIRERLETMGAGLPS